MKKWLILGQQQEKQKMSPQYLIVPKEGSAPKMIGTHQKKINELS